MTPHPKLPQPAPRFAAYVIDLTIGLGGAGLVGFCLMLGALLGFRTFLGDADSGVVSLIAVLLFLGFIFIGPALYEAVFVSSAWQATPGKRIVGMQVQTARGERVAFGRAFVRGMVKLLTMWLLYPAAALVWIDPRRRGPWDLLVGSVVTSKNM